MYLDGSCPDQHSVSFSNPAGWGVYFATLNLDFFGPVGSLPFLVKGSNNTAELQAPLEAISYILDTPSIPTNIHFHFDSQYVIDILQGLSLPSANLQLATLLLDYYTHLSAIASITIHKVKPHTGIPGNERADINADNGVTRRTSIGRYASFPPASLFSIPLTSTVPMDPDTFTSCLVSTLTIASQSSFPQLTHSARKPYLSENTLRLTTQIQTLPESEKRAARLRIKRSALKDKKRWLLSKLHEDNQSTSAADQWHTLRRIRSTYSPATQSVNNSDGTPVPRSQKSSVLADHLHGLLHLSLLLMMIQFIPRYHLINHSPCPICCEPLNGHDQAELPAQTSCQLRHWNSCHTSSNDPSLIITTNVFFQLPHHHIGNLPKWLCYTKVTTKIVALRPVIVLFHSLTLSTKIMLPWSNHGCLTILIIAYSHSSLDFVPGVHFPLHCLFFAASLSFLNDTLPLYISSFSTGHRLSIQLAIPPSGPTLRWYEFCIYCNTFPLGLDYLSIHLNANFSPYMACYRSLFLPVYHHYSLVPVNIVPRLLGTLSIMKHFFHP